MPIIPALGEAKAKRIQVQGQSEQLGNLLKPCHKIKNKIKRELRMWLSEKTLHSFPSTIK